MRPAQLPPASRLWEAFDLKPLTGELIRKDHSSAGKRGGQQGRHHYTRLDKKSYCTHRLVWKWVHGADPAQQIDHINRRPDDNRPWNLRVADQRENMINMVRAGKGYRWNRSIRRWRVETAFAGDRKIWDFRTKEEAAAHALKVKAAREVWLQERIKKGEAIAPPVL